MFVEYPYLEMTVSRHGTSSQDPCVLRISSPTKLARPFTKSRTTWVSMSLSVTSAREESLMEKSEGGRRPLVSGGEILRVLISCVGGRLPTCPFASSLF